MDKKGFTLIELLAVIVILAIVALILVPVISNVIDSARKAAFRETVNGIIESADNYVGEYVLINHNDPIYPIEIYCNGSECEDSNGKKLEFKGKVPISGKVILESSNLVRADLISDGVYCGSGTKGNVEVYSKCSELDHTNPIIDESKINDIVISTTTNALTLSMPIDLMYDDETGISRYDIDLYLGNNKVASKEYEEPYITFTNLKSDTEYKVVITGINGNRGKTSIDKYGTTLDITKPTITYTNDPTSDINGYFRSQTLNVSYTKGNVENPEYYIRSGRSASTNINVIAICGTTTNPSDCSEMTGTTIEADTWYKVSGNISVIYNVNATSESSLTAIIYDGTNYESSDTKIVAKIDKEGPTTPTGGAIGNISGSNPTGTIATAASGSTDAGTGGITYKYLVTNTNTAPNKNDVGFTTSRNFTRSCGTSYYGWAIAEDALGNRSDVKSLGSTADGANSYSGWSACSASCGGGTQTRTNSCALVTTGFSQSCNTQSCCSYAANQQVFKLETAGASSFTVPAGCTGIYTLQVYGAQGGQVHISPGGAGGYAYGNMRITAGTTIYIYVGGQGPTCGVSAAAYNGGTGGSGSCDFSRTGDEIVGGGGGATHMATVNRGELKNYNSYRNEVIIVAGGGGGGYGYKGWNSDGGYERNTAGGTGGGTDGGSTSGSGYGFGIGGSQSAAGGSGGFGYGSANGGGGGWFGGGQAGNAGAAGGGGSGYLNTSYLISGTTGMANGQKGGAGAAYITFRSLN